MCTGAMTAEMARACLQQAVTASGFPMDIQTVALWERNAKCHPLILNNIDWVNSLRGRGREERPHLFQDILDLNPPGCLRKVTTYAGKRRAVESSPCVQEVPCLCCMEDVCRVPGADFGVSGLPCEDMSRAGHQKLRHGKTNSVYMTHGKYTAAHQVPLFVVECTPELDMGMMEEVHPDYDLIQTFCDPGDTGHEACSRSRTYVIGAHKNKTEELEEPCKLQDKIQRHIRKRVQTVPSDYMIATGTEISLEAQQMARKRGIQWRPEQTDLGYLLNPREKSVVQEYEKIYRQRTGSSMVANEDMVCFLGDNPRYTLSWSLHGRLPTYRRNNGLLWIPSRQRKMTGKERLVSLGWPVTAEIASAMQVPMVPALDVQRAADLAGNSMHFLNTGVQQLIALACFGPCRNESIFC
ncbi:unnamed protein product [Symbiodinium necroappetens]|uniref:Uncharacterized protein n=1 Tax=Symbiodinium necroappetens TaxID=1628268 RepID=A0A812W010_9DINO|nr:unnamed protein product [Symbiodinium necroappetens]